MSEAQFHYFSRMQARIFYGGNSQSYGPGSISRVVRSSFLMLTANYRRGRQATPWEPLFVAAFGVQMKKKKRIFALMFALTTGASETWEFAKRHKRVINAEFESKYNTFVLFCALGPTPMCAGKWRLLFYFCVTERIQTKFPEKSLIFHCPEYF